MKLCALACFTALVAGVQVAGEPAQQGTARTTPVAVIDKRQRECAPDACLNALQASAQCSCIRMGSADCDAYLATTLTPEASTVYQTVSVYATSTATESETITTTTAVTAIATYEEGATTTFTITTSTIAEAVAFNQVGKKIKKRTVEKRMPFYASACSGLAGYSSACSCLGATGTTRWAKTPITTITVSETYTSDTLTETTPVLTESSTTTVDITTTTKTITDVVASASVTAYYPAFYIQVQSADGPVTNVVGKYVQNNFGSNDYTRINFVATDTSSASPFYIDGTGLIRPVLAPYTDEYFIYHDQSTGLAGMWLWRHDESVSSGYTFLDCTVTPGTNELACGARSTTGMDTFWACSDNTAYFASAATSNAGCSKVVLVAVPSY